MRLGIYFEMIRADGSVGDSMTLTSAPATPVNPLDKLPVIWGDLKSDRH